MAKTFAVLSGDLVANIIVAETQADAELATNRECIEYTADNPAGDGMVYDRKTKKFYLPDPTPAAVEPTA